uniref:Uncharacterized protein n=1 Tax=Ananas comosus var. bracteatus TaxID=296719 RepID=A0A6V7P445_ANACO|nr:unnamed protein product [Ananas comosus var. bracteatus]
MSKEPPSPMNSSRQFGVAEILREALYLPTRNKKLMLPTMLLAFLTSTFSFIARLFYVYLAMVWMVGLVISIVEEGCYGLEALDKAKDVTKGKRMQGYLIAIVFLLGDGVLNVGYIFEMTNGGGSHVVNKRGNGLVMFCVYMLLKMFSCMVYSVYYCECKMSQEKENDVARSFTYTRVIDDTPSVDEQLA